MPYANLGVVDNKGFEATLEYTQQLGKKCFLTVRGNFSWNEDKIIENDDPRVQYPWMEKRGTNVNGRWGWIAEGLFTSEEEIMDHAKQFGECGMIFLTFVIHNQRQRCNCLREEDDR